jgi:lipooligosaccharide transport system permease protein
MPLYLFSGTFFSVDQLPAALRVVAYATPLWHGVALCRSLSLGTATWAGAALHVGYLLGLTALGIVAASRTFRRRLHA